MKIIKKASANLDKITITYEEPSEFEVLGRIFANSKINANEDENQKLIIKKLKVKAAKLGANAIIIDSVRKKSWFLTIPFIKSKSTNVSLTVTGRAILINENENTF